MLNCVNRIRLPSAEFEGAKSDWSELLATSGVKPLPSGLTAAIPESPIAPGTWVKAIRPGLPGKAASLAGAATSTPRAAAAAISLVVLVPVPPMSSL